MNTNASLGHQLVAAFGSLKLRITLGAITALVLGIVMTTVVLVQRTERDTLAAVRERELAEASRAAMVLSRQAVELQRALTISSARFDASRIDEQAAVDEFLRSVPILQTMFESVYIADAKGRVRALADGSGIQHPTLNLGDRPHIQQALHERRPIVSRALLSRRHGDTIIVFVQPLVDAKGVHGVLAGSLNLNRRNPMGDLIDPGSGSDDALRVISDGQGRILAHPNPALVLSPLSAEPRLAAAAGDWQSRGSPVEPSGLTILDSAGVVTAAGAAGLDWVVWRVVGENELFAPLRAARRDALQWAAVLIAVCSALILFGLGRLLRPLRQVQDRAGRMFDDTLDTQHGWPTVGGEIGSLANVLRHIGAERARLEASNNHLLQQLGSVMSNAPVGLAFTRDRRFELVSSEFCRLLGRTEIDLLGQPAEMIYVSQADYEALGAKVGAAFARGEAYVGDVQMRRADDSFFWSHLRGRPVDAADGNAGTIWTITDVTEEVATRGELEWAASHDALTGLANRQALETRLSKIFESRPNSLPSSLLMIDLDNFKQVNDSAGHAAGDTVLCAVASTLMARVRSRDLAVRFGGDEFVVLLDHCPRDAAMRLAGELAHAIAAIALPVLDSTVKFGASIGVAELNSDFSDIHAWVNAADKACYEAKAAGRNRVHGTAHRTELRVVTG